MPFQDGYALLIGIGSYSHHHDLDLPETVHDVQAVQRILQDPSLCGYLPARVSLLHDASASHPGIIDEFSRLAGLVQPEHTLTVFYCGHGAYGDDGNYYLTTHDTRVKDGKVVAGSGFCEAELLEALRKIKARRLLLFFNACHSGEISPTLGMEEKQTLDSLSLPETTTEALLSSGEGRIIITACRSEQKSWIGSGPLTLFGRALVDGLSGRGVVGNHGYISAYNLYESIFQSVSEAAQQFGKVQEPELTVLKGVGPFPVALHRGASSLGNFDANDELPPGMAARAVDPALSRRRFEQIIRNISASSQGVAVGGDVKDSVINTGTINGPLYNIQGDIHAGRDVVQGDQFNYMENVAPPQSKDEFIAALVALQAQIAELKRQPELTTVQQVNIQAAERKMAEAAREAKKQNPAGASIRSMLAEAKEFMDVLSSSLTSAITLGTSLGTLAMLALKLFGG